MNILSPRPRGLRKSWRRDEGATCASIGAYLAGHPLVGPELGEPVEAQQFIDSRGQIRRVEAAWANGRIISYSRTRAGGVIRFYRR